MAALDLEEQEQISEIKAWWARYGTLITAAAVAAAVAAVGWQGWSRYQTSQAGQASVLFSAVQKASTDKDVKKLAATAGELIEKYPRTTQASLAVLIAAKAQVDAGDLKSAKTQLAWAVEKAPEAELREIARLRLVAILLDEKAYDDALKQLSNEPPPAFVARHNDLKGDVLLAQNKPAEAKAAYQAAIAAIDKVGSGNPMAPSRLKQVVQLKLETIGGAQ